MTESIRTVKPKEKPIAVSVTAAAVLLGCHRNSVSRLVKGGHLVPVVLPGGMKRIRVADIEALVDAPPRGLRVPSRKRGGG